MIEVFVGMGPIVDTDTFGVYSAQTTLLVSVLMAQLANICTLDLNFPRPPIRSKKIRNLHQSLFVTFVMNMDIRLFTVIK